MYKDEVDNFFSTPSGKYDKQVVFTIDEVVELLRSSRVTIRKAIYSGKLKASKLGRHYLISRLSLYKYVESMELPAR